MAELTENQIEQVIVHLEHQIERKLLRNELIDHCCCAVEELLDKGHSFDDALRRAIHNLHPNGLSAIETDVQIALNQIIPLLMKKLLYFSGFIASFSLGAGLLFRFMHWPGVTEIMLMGNLFLFLTMVSLLVQLLRFPSAFQGLTYARTLSGVIAGMLIAVGMVFKMFHWPSANIQFMLGMVILTVVFIPLFFWQLYQREMRNSAAA